jgi:hypothetical protein
MRHQQGGTDGDGEKPPPIVDLVNTAAQKCHNKNAVFNTFIKESRLAECLTKKDRNFAGLMGHVKSFDDLLTQYPELKRTIERVYHATAAEESESQAGLNSNTLRQLVQGSRTALNMADPDSEEYQTLPETRKLPSGIALSEVKFGGALTMKPRVAYQLSVVYNNYGSAARNEVLETSLDALRLQKDKENSPAAAAAGTGDLQMWVHETGFRSLTETHVKQARLDLGYVKEKPLARGE